MCLMPVKRPCAHSRENCRASEPGCVLLVCVCVVFLIVAAGYVLHHVHDAGACVFAHLLTCTMWFSCVYVMFLHLLMLYVHACVCCVWLVVGTLPLLMEAQMWFMAL